MNTTALETQHYADADTFASYLMANLGGDSLRGGVFSDFDHTLANDRVLHPNSRYIVVPPLTLQAVADLRRIGLTTILESVRHPTAFTRALRLDDLRVLAPNHSRVVTLNGAQSGWFEYSATQARFDVDVADTYPLTADQISWVERHVASYMAGEPMEEFAVETNGESRYVEVFIYTAGNGDEIIFDSRIETKADVEEVLMRYPNSAEARPLNLQELHDLLHDEATRPAMVLIKKNGVEVPHINGAIDHERRSRDIIRLQLPSEVWTLQNEGGLFPQFADKAYAAIRAARLSHVLFEASIGMGDNRRQDSQIGKQVYGTEYRPAWGIWVRRQPEDGMQYHGSLQTSYVRDYRQAALLLSYFKDLLQLKRTYAGMTL